jgi:hypothetical protein
VISSCGITGLFYVKHFLFNTFSVTNEISIQSHPLNIFFVSRSEIYSANYCYVNGVSYYLIWSAQNTYTKVQFQDVEVNDSKLD